MTNRRRALALGWLLVGALAFPLRAALEPGRGRKPGEPSRPERASVPRLPDFLRGSSALPPSAVSPKAAGGAPQAAPKPPAGSLGELENAERKSAELRQSPQSPSDEGARAAGGETFDAAASVVPIAEPGETAAPWAEADLSGQPRGPPRYSAGQGFSRLLERAVERRHLSLEVAVALREVGYRDSMTGLPNRLFLDENIPDLVARHKSLVSFKLDFLKELNDLYGHEVGSRAIRAAVALAGGMFGREAVVVRRSPTKFDIFLNAPASDAAAAAEALRAAAARLIGDLSVVLNGERPLSGVAFPGTLSLGVSALAGGASPEASYREAFDEAERARRAAKQSGGNKVAVSEGAEVRLAASGGLEEAAAALRGGRWSGLEGRIEALKGANLKALLAREPAEDMEAGKLLKRVGRDDLRSALAQIIYLNRHSRLRNRKFFWERLASNFGQGGYDHYLAIDIDGFGELNEKLGEEKVDLFLKELGPILLAEQKKEDALSFHLGGDEFAVLTGSQLLDPRAFAERLRERVMSELGGLVARKHGVVDPATGRPFEVTVSIGVAKISRDFAGPRENFVKTAAAAEAMVQRAKDNGRNRVEPPAPSRD